METFDVVVLGTGAAGLTAAITAHEGGATVAVFEKADKVGGTTAWSGGQVWIPNNPHMAAVGTSDDRDQAITYIMSLSRDMLEQRLVEAYVDAGPEMVELLEAKTPVQFYAVPGMPDYHPEFPGGSPGGGRTLECPIYPFDELGEWASRLTPSPYFTDPHITMSETPLGKAVIRRPGSAVTVLAYGTMVYVAQAAAEETGVDAEIIDLRTLLPLDLETIVASVKKTGRCLVVHEATLTSGFGAELSALVQENCFYHLEAPVGRVAGWDTPYPHAQEWDYFPGPARIGRALTETMGA